MKNLLRSRSLAILALIAMTSLSIYAFAAANITTESGAGDGSGSVSGYVISAVQYSLLASDPTRIGTVSFDVSSAATGGNPSQVQVSLDGATWAACAGGGSGAAGSGAFSCTFPSGNEPLISSLDVM